MNTPYIVKIDRGRIRKLINEARSIRRLRRRYFHGENHRVFVIELLLFALFGALSAWPIIDTVRALHLL